MKSLLRTALLAATFMTALPALAQEAKPEGKDYTVLKVGGDEIKNSEVMDVWKSLFPGGSAPDFSSFDENIRQNVLRGLVSEKLIYKEAIKAGYDKNDEVKKRLEALQKQVIMQTFMEQKAKELVNDKELQAAYDEKVKAAKGQEEIKARHILVGSEEEAKKIAAELKKGGSFDKIAKEKSTDKGSGAKGGDLGWFTQDKMVPEFGDAAFKLKKGEISAPVKSPFGWHIIKVDDRRAVQVASFDDMKENLKNELANKAVQNYVEGLLKTADVTYYGPDGKEKPFSRSLAPAAGGDAPAAPEGKNAKPAEKQ